MPGVAEAASDSAAIEREAFGAQPIQSMTPTIANHTVKVLVKMFPVLSIISLSHRLFRKGILGLAM